MTKHTIVVCDHIHEDGLNILQNTQDINYVYAADIDKTALLDVVKDADVVITRSSTDVDERFLSSATNLKALIRAGKWLDDPANRPKAVAIKASAIPGATTAIVACLTEARPIKECIIPQTVPKRPI